MLSRVANTLYWMVCYVERADNLARLIDVNQQLLLDSQRLDSERLRAFWQPIILGTDDAFTMGLHRYLDALQARFYAIGEAVFESDVLMPERIQVCPAAEFRSSSALAAWQQQQQQQQ